MYPRPHKYKFIADPDDLLTNNIKTIYVNNERYMILSKKAHIIKKCRKFYNVWNYRIIKHSTTAQYILITSSQERNKWYIVPYDKKYLNVLPKSIDRTYPVLTIDFSIKLEERDFYDVPLDD
tara:strand:- start:106 stop:471 length:366 start_codon:yes stop_codon:yes gene_type:complete